MFERPALLALTAAALLAISNFASSQGTPRPEAEPTQVLEITGSRIRGPSSQEAAAVQVVTIEELRRAGVGSLREAIDSLAASAGGTSDVGGVASFAAGSSGASLRHLGKQATLVLLNSRRVAPYPLADYSEIFTNIDALPFEAIDRIEVLKIGGAALYGSEAVAGVINVITRTGWRGLQARASGQQSITSGEFGSRTLSLTWGLGGLSDHTGLEGGGAWLVNLETFKRDGLMWREVLGYVDPKYQQASPGLGSLSTYSWPGNVIGAGGGAVPGCAAELLIGGLCRYDRYERFEVVPAARRVNFLVSGEEPLGAFGRVFSEVLWSRTETRYRQPHPAYGLLGTSQWADPNTNARQTFWYRGLPAGHPLNPTGQDDTEFRYRFVDAPSDFTARTVQYRALSGLRGTSSGFDLEAALGVAGGSARFEQRSGYSVSGFREVVGNFDPEQVDPLFFNRGYRIGQSNNPEVIDRLFPAYGYRGQVRHWFVDARASGSPWRLDAGPVGTVAGVELRRERFTVDPDKNLRSGDIVGNGLAFSDAARNVLSTFAEAELPLASTLRAQLAARFDKYERETARLSPKLALRWQADTSVLLRATAETGFRAPNLVESAASTKFAFDNGVTDPRRCPAGRALALDLIAAAEALPAGDPQQVLLLARAESVFRSTCQTSTSTIVLNNPDLKPESSRSYSLGLVFTPNRTLSVSIDLWSIERRNEIGRLGTAELLAAEAVLPAGVVVRAPLSEDQTFSTAEQVTYGVTAGGLVVVVGRFENLSRAQTSGVDLALKSRTPTPFGRLDVTTDLTYLGKIRQWSTNRGDWGDNLAGRNGFPRWRGALTFALDTGNWVQMLRASGYSRTALRGDYFDSTYSPEGCADAGFTAAECSVASFVRWDWGLTFKGWRTASMSATVGNVFRRRAPTGLAAFVNSGGVVPPTDEDARGRMLRLALELRMD
jgi:iron complex outermembrane recepter protein